MAVVSTGLNVAGLKSEYMERFSAAKTVWQDLATTIQSNKNKEDYAFLGAVPQMRLWGTGRKSRGLFKETYSVPNMKYELTLEIDRDEISDDQTGQIKIRIAEMALKAATHPDFLLADLIKNGATAGFNSYDGVTFFNSAHVSGLSGVQDNTLAPAAVVTTDPTVAECKTAVKQAIARLLGFVDDQGEPMNIDAQGLVLITPPSMYLTMLEAISATLIDSTSNVLTGAARVISFSRLTDAKTFILAKTEGVTVRPWVFQSREPVEFNAIAGGSEEEFLREKHLYGVRGRYAMTYGYWQHATKNTFA